MEHIPIEQQLRRKKEPQPQPTPSYRTGNEAFDALMTELFITADRGRDYRKHEHLREKKLLLVRKNELIAEIQKNLPTLGETERKQVCDELWNKLGIMLISD